MSQISSGNDGFGLTIDSTAATIGVAIASAIVWPLRNMLSRKLAVLLDKIVSKIDWTQPARMIIQFREGERQAIYWNPNKSRFYVYNYRWVKWKTDSLGKPFDKGTTIYLDLSEDLQAQRDIRPLIKQISENRVRVPNEYVDEFERLHNE